jgi:hypothetical protein
MPILIIVLSVLLAVPVVSHAAAGTEGAAFLNIPVGGAPAAMGSAYTALATDAYAPVLNPGGLGFASGTQLAGHHVSYLETSRYQFASLTHQLAPTRALGLSAQYLGSGDMIGRDTTGNETGSYSAHYGAYSIAFGQAINSKLSLGVTGRWINAQIDNVSANAYAADAGALMKFSNRFQGGLVVSNAGSELEFLDEGDPLPLAIRAGVAGFLPHNFTVSADGAYHPEESRVTGHFGTQWQVVPLLALRAGYRTDTIKELSALAGLSTGIGLSLWGSEFSYTWLLYDDLGQTHSFALLLRFGEARKNATNVIQHQAGYEPPIEELLAATERLQTTQMPATSLNKESR